MEGIPRLFTGRNNISCYHALPSSLHEGPPIHQASSYLCPELRLPVVGSLDILEADHMPYFQLFVLRLVSMIRRKRFVVIWHEVWGPAYWRQYLGMMGWGAWAVEWLGMRLPKHIVAASPQTAERL